jgi:hypothetical protein
MIQLADYIDISVAVSAIGLIKQLLRCASRVLCSSYISSSLQVTLTFFCQHVLRLDKVLTCIGLKLANSLLGTLPSLFVNLLHIRTQCAVSAVFQ